MQVQVTRDGNAPSRQPKQGNGLLSESGGYYSCARPQANRFLPGGRDTVRGCTVSDT
jgi:hypothetical protein